MSQDKSNLKFDNLNVQIRDSVRDFAEKLMTALGDSLQSITVVGSSLTDDFAPAYSDINTVIVLGEQKLTSLNAIAAMARPMSRKRISPPLLMTPSYIERSLDVFGVEFLDFQLTHQTVLGDDPFTTRAFDKKDVRLQCERELKAMLIRLRQGYIAASANKRIVRDILISTARGLAPLLRAMLWLKDRDRPPGSSATFAKAAGEFLIKTDSLATAGRWRREKIRLSETEMQSAFESIYATIERLADIVDELEV
ncbi:MAG: hypothetical protein AMJ65_11625 [Phycisphaerae bacterium SG8_4]|nr:MAG: hypothetical protein AMJ65_11625 [Phycisphaerae bacterium SG8_4]